MTTTGITKSESLGAIYECVPSSLSVLVHKNRSLDSFILALEQSTAQHAGHDDILRRIREEQKRRESLLTIEPASPPILVVPAWAFNFEIKAEPILCQ